MAEKEQVRSPKHLSIQQSSSSEEDASSPTTETIGLTDAQKDVLERCLHALTHAKNDSHILAALLLITRLCPANQLDPVTLHRVFEAVGWNLPVRLLMTAIQGNESSGLPPNELLSLGTALLAGLSTDADMASHPQLLSTIPIILGLLETGGLVSSKKTQAAATAASSEDMQPSENTVFSQTTQSTTVKEGQQSPSVMDQKEEVEKPTLDEAVAADCYHVLNIVCALPRGPDQLLSRGAIPALCKSVILRQKLSSEKGIPLLARLLSSNIRQRAWNKHPSELLALLELILQNFTQAPDQNLLDMCTQIPRFLPPSQEFIQSTEFQSVVARIWATLRPLVQQKLSIEELGQVLVLSACLLDLYGWYPVGPPKFCCLLVNRACVEVRMALEEPPGTQLSAEQQQTVTACYRIMEAAIEQACCTGDNSSSTKANTAKMGLSLQQSRQLLNVLEEAFSAVIYYLQQVDASRYDDPFLFATFRSLCAWLAEETSCLKEEITALLPFLIAYTKHHLQNRKDKGLADWMSEMSVSEGFQREPWTGEDVLRYLLPALCHLSAEDGPRKVLLSLDIVSSLVKFLTHGWGILRAQSGKSVRRDPSLETACSSLLNFVVTEPEMVRSDASFATLEMVLSEALPILLHKSSLLVFTANCCTLVLMINRLKPTSPGPPSSSQHQLFTAIMRFLCGALQPGERNGRASISTVWAPWWEEVCELWRLSFQALGDCVNTHPWVAPFIREEGFLQNILCLLDSSCGLPDSQSQDAMEEALCAFARQCPSCHQDIGTYMKKEIGGSFHGMIRLKKMYYSKKHVSGSEVQK